MPRGIPLSEEELRTKRAEILKAALPLFAEKGFNETSMREVGQAAGLGKSTLYDYFPNKEEILLFFVDQEVQQLTVMAGKIASSGESAAQKLRQILRRQLDHQLANKQLYLKLSLEVQRLGADNRKHVQEIRHSYQDRLSGIIEEGIRAGHFRQVNPLLAVRTLLTILSSAVFTTRPTGSPEEMLDQAFNLFFEGLEVK